MADDTNATRAVSSQALLVIFGQAQGTVLPIPVGELLLGREASQAGRLGGDPLLAPRHAKISRNAYGEAFLEDLGSANGTFLNGARVTGRQPMHTNDVIDVGATKLQVLQASPARDTGGRVRGPGLADEEPASEAWEGFGTGDTAPPDPRTTPTPGPSPDDAAQRRSKGTTAAGPRAERAPPPATGRATVSGQARGIQQRTESIGSGSLGVWTFRIERYDRDGNRLPPIPAQMRGVVFEGSVSEGDEVRVIGVWKDGTLHSERVENLTTGAAFKVKSFKTLLLVCVIFVIVMFISFALIFHVSVQRDQQESCEYAKRNGITGVPGC
jgi:hypothetical protein